MQIIALTGYKQSGKSTIAETLREELGLRRMAFADPVKWAVADLYDLSYDQLYGDLKETPDPRYHLTPRAILQRFGTEVCRQIHPNTWTMHMRRRIDIMVKNFNPAGIIIDDVRFDNEVALIHELCGEVWLISRPGYGSDGHASEQLPLGADRSISNYTSIEALTIQALAAARRRVVGL